LRSILLTKKNHTTKSRTTQFENFHYLCLDDAIPLLIAAAACPCPTAATDARRGPPPSPTLAAEIIATDERRGAPSLLLFASIGALLLLANAFAKASSKRTRSTLNGNE
jgi:hypothetical protein